ncbi:hypothetical protein [Agrococcus sp. KRD186]|uniref:hypothetical protein n=1 Tax=Agrococcus sp. KRD186 TaxID=2729730 RepID=UPI0019D291E7|nr:hypothetical protein [Agrococcus sp. KRD186]
MTYQDEESIKSALQIDSWRNLSKEKFLAFAGNLDKIDKDVALAIVGEFTNFKALASDALHEVTQQFEAVLRSHDEGSKDAYKGWKRYQKQLQRELDRPDLTSEERYQFLMEFRAASEAISKDGDKRNAFLLKIAGVAATVVVTIVAAAVAVLGGKSQLGPGTRS